MGIKSHYLKDANDNKFYPVAHANATFDENGVRVGTRLNIIEKNIDISLETINNHIENNDKHFSNEEREKLSKIEDGANKNIQADWDETDINSDSYIRNKPSSLKANGGNADTVNGHTVKTDVPENAVFTDTTYLSGTGINIEGTTINNTGVRNISTGSTNGTISVNTNGISSEIAVKGLGSAAYTDSTIYDTKGSANSALTSAKSYTDTKVSDLVGSSSVSNQIDSHNTSASAHADIRNLISSLTTKLNTLADSDDTTLDQMSEIVAYIKANKTLIDSITTSKVNVSDIVNNLTTNITNKPLAASQGVAIKLLIDALQTELTSHTDDTTVHITSTERTNWNDSNSKKHTHSNKSVLDGITSSLVNTWNNVTNKLDKTGDASNLTNTITTAATRENLTSGEKLSISLGKISKWFSDLKTVALTGSYNDLSNKPTIPSVGNGTITITQNGITKGSFTTNQSGNTTIALTDTNTDTNTTYSVVTQSSNGLMSSSDKKKLDGIETGANKTIIDTTLSSSSTNPVQNKIIYTALNNKITKNPFSNGGTSGTNGYVVIAQLKVTNSYANRPIEFELIRRSSPTPCYVSVAFTNVGTNDPSINRLTYFGADYGVFIHKTTTSTWLLYASKSESYDEVTVTRIQYAEQGIDITHPSGFITEKPTSNIVNAALGWNVGYATTATIATKLGSSTVGSATQPIYLNAGTATPCTYTLAKSVPSNAVFTDTTYSTFVKSGSGAKSGLVPAPSTTAGTTKYLREDGTWTVPPNTNTDTKVTNTLATTTKAYITGTTSSTTNTGTQVFDTGVYLGTTSGSLYATTFYGKTSSPSTAGSWLSGMTLSNASLGISTQQTSSSYHPYFAVKTSGNHVVNLGGLGDNVGFYGYKSGRTENGTDWSCVFNASTGKLSSSGGFSGSLFGNATTSTTLATARTINGTSFDGSANITTANWGTARTVTIGAKGKSVNGSGNVSWTLAEIGAVPSTHEKTSSSEPTGQSVGDFWLQEY